LADPKRGDLYSKYLGGINRVDDVDELDL
jgi:hypothetical protein